MEDDEPHVGSLATKLLKIGAKYKQDDVQLNATKSAYDKAFSKLKGYIIKTLTNGESIPLKVSNWLTSRPTAAVKYLIDKTIGKTGKGAAALQKYSTYVQKYKDSTQAARAKVAKSFKEYADTHKAKVLLDHYDSAVKKYKAATSAIQASKARNFGSMMVQEGMGDLKTLGRLTKEAKVTYSLPSRTLSVLSHLLADSWLYC